MTPSEKAVLLARFNCNPPIAPFSIRQVEKDLGFSLPEDYAEFIVQSNGGEGFIGSAYAILWRVEELKEMNKAYQVAELVPGLFFFGSDGGGEAFAFDMRSDAKAIVTVPFIGMELTLVRPVASNFSSFLGELFKS